MTVPAATTAVPFADLHAQYLSIKDEIDAAIAEVIATSAFVRGPHVDRFEANFAAAVGARHCVSCGNGTDALYIALRGLDVKPGDEVLVPAHSWISTSAAVTQAGATPVFCDTHPLTFTIDPRQIEARVTPRTVGIIPVHLYGQPADMTAVMALAERHGLWVLEDCAQAHLATWQGRQAGSFGRVATYSFYPGKNLGAMGDAGAVVTQDPALAERMAKLARHGGLRKGDHHIEGFNSRMDGLQAAVLSVKLRHLPAWTAARRACAARYRTLLAGMAGLTLPHVAPGADPVWHLYVVQHAQRDALARHLAAESIQTVINYPVALPFLPAYERFGHRPEEFPVAYAHQSRVLSLPLFPEMSEGQMARVAEALGAFVDKTVGNV